MVVVLQSFF